MNIKSFLDSIPPDEREAFAVRCGTSIGHLRNISYGYRSCAESLAINIERETHGAVRVEELRPDVDWQYIRGTEPQVA